MALEVGSKLGHYDVTALIGEGGMGEVYRVRDTKLDRDVTLKVLPEAFMSDPDRLARFEREAKVLASLNHPNIAAIYGLEETDDTQAFMLELVEGPTLADRIKQGAIPVDEALHFGLAKAFTGDAPDADLSQSSTLTVSGTRQGVILETLAGSAVCLTTTSHPMGVSSW